MKIEITEFRNAVYTAVGNIDCEINHPTLGWLPFHAIRDDDGAQFDVAEFFDRMVASGEVAPYVPPPQEVVDAEKAAEVRGTRNNLLSNLVDPIVSNPLRWADLTSEKQAEWTAYRRALLDITNQEGFPHDVMWPIQPE